jgi:predicted TIM-barrel fold metal-dependent hydrolase
VTDPAPPPNRRPPRVDAHVHGFPDRLALAVRHHLNRSGHLHGGVLLADVARSVAAHRFDAAWLLPYAHKAGVAASINAWSATEVRRYPRLIPGATFHPADPDLPELVRRAMVELGLRVVKLHCAVGDFAPSDQRLRPLWATAARLGVPVVIHAGRRSPGETAADELDELVPVLRAEPELRLVLAHAGYPATARTLELMGEFTNLYADVTPVWDRAAPVGRRELEALTGRFLFGSDAPNNPIPAAEQARRFETLGLDAAALASLLGGAAVALVPPSGDGA